LKTYLKKIKDWKSRKILIKRYWKFEMWCRHTQLVVSLRS